MNVVSPTGCVHIIEWDYSQDDHVAPEFKHLVTTMCHHTNQSRWTAIGHYDLDWPKTDKPATCRRCLAALEKDSDA